MTPIPCIPVYPETVVTHWSADEESEDGPRIDWFDGDSSWTWSFPQASQPMERAT